MIQLCWLQTQPGESKTKLKIELVIISGQLWINSKHAQVLK